MALFKYEEFIRFSAGQKYKAEEMQSLGINSKSQSHQL